MATVTVRNEPRYTIELDAKEMLWLQETLVTLVSLDKAKQTPEWKRIQAALKNPTLER